MSFSDGVRGKVNVAKLHCFAPVIPGLGRPFLGKRNNNLATNVIADRIKHKLSGD